MTLPAAGARGPQAEQVLTDDELGALLEEARAAGAEIAGHQQAMLEPAARRRAAIRRAHRGGLSVRRLATALEVSPSTVRDALSDEGGGR